MITRRGKRVRAIALGIVALSIIYFISTHVNWVGDRYCLGSIESCYKLEGGNK